MKESTPPRPPSGGPNLHLLMVLSIAVAVASIIWAIALVGLEARLVLLAVVLLLPSLLAVTPLHRRARRGSSKAAAPTPGVEPAEPPADLLAEWLAANARRHSPRKERNP